MASPGSTGRENNDSRASVSAEVAWLCSMYASLADTASAMRMRSVSNTNSEKAIQALWVM